MTPGQNWQPEANLPRLGSQILTAPVTTAHAFSQNHRAPEFHWALFFSTRRH